MTVSAEQPVPSQLRPGRGRPAAELAVAVLYRPLAEVVVRALLPLRVAPPALVLVHTLVGLVAAVAVHEGALLLAAGLLQVKTILDNADGRLARASGRVTAFGRYLDTEADFLVNAALFVALGLVTGEPALALAAFLVLTFVLSADFNAAVAYVEAGEELEVEPALPGGRLERALAFVYRVLFAPQDRLLRAIDAGRLERILAGTDDPKRRRAATLAYYDRGTVVVLANLGLSTQLLALSICLVLGVPVVYLVLAPAALALLPVLQLRRERRARRALDG